MGHTVDRRIEAVRLDNIAEQILGDTTDRDGLLLGLVLVARRLSQMLVDIAPDDPAPLIDDLINGSQDDLAGITSRCGLDQARHDAAVMAILHAFALSSAPPRQEDWSPHQ